VVKKKSNSKKTTNFKKRSPSFLIIILLVVVVSAILIKLKYERITSKSNIVSQSTNSQLESTSSQKSLQPSINGTTYTTPILENWRKLEFIIPAGWEVVEDNYPYSDLGNSTEGVFFYSLSLRNIKNPTYLISIGGIEATDGGAICLYDKKDAQNDEPFREYYPRYDVVETNFGTIRLSFNPTLNRFYGCQYKPYSGYDDAWVSLTRIGYLTVFVPENYDSNTYREMVNFIKGIKQVITESKS
jgi:hypothetical protein